MKKFFKIALSILLFLISLIFIISAVVTVIDSFDDYYPLTSLFPTLFFLSLGALGIFTGLRILTLLKFKKRYLAIGVLIVLCLLALMKPFNAMALNSWDRYIKLTYTGADIEPFTKTTRLKYTLENTTNRHLEDVVVVFTCQGHDADGNDVVWDAEYETHQDIEPNNEVDISVLTGSLEINDYNYWKSEVKFVAFEK